MDTYSEIAGLILQMAETDQKIRQKPNVTAEEMIAIDSANRAEMIKIMGKYGLISQSKFGKAASYMAWLLVQHFPPKEIEFMKRYLQLMKESIADVDKRNVAYLEDRIALYENAPQTYGTQIKPKDGQLHFYALKNVNDVDNLRKGMGLGTLREYSLMFKTQVVLPEGYEG